MLGIYYCRYAALPLGLGYGVDGQRGLTRRFGAVDLDDTSARKTAHAESGVQRYRTGGYHLYVFYCIVTQTHYGA